MNTTTISQRLENLPITNFQRTIFAVIATAWFFDCLDVAMMTFVLSPIAQEFHLDKTQIGMLGSMAFIGMFFGAGLAGVLADKFGRLIVFRLSIVLWGLASIACAFAPNIETLMVLRIFLGMGMAMELPVGQSLLCEFVPARVRGKYVAMLEGMWPIGFIAAGLLATVVLPIWGWRGAFIAEAIPALFVLVIRRIVPESPRWLAESGQIQKAHEVTTHIESKVNALLAKSGKEPIKNDYLVVDSINSTEERHESKVAVAVLERPEHGADIAASGGSGGTSPGGGSSSHSAGAAGSPPKRKDSSAASIFKGIYLKRTVMLWTLWFFALLGYYGLTTWLGALLEDKGLDFAKSNEYIIQMSLAGIPGFFTAAWLVESWGRKPTMILTLVASAISAYFYGTAGDITMMICYGLLMQFFFFGMWSALYAYTPELYPTHARATGTGFASSFGRIGALLGPYLIGVIIGVYGQPGVFAMAAGALVLAAVAVAVLGEETKGKVLEHI